MMMKYKIEQMKKNWYKHIMRVEIGFHNFIKLKVQKAEEIEDDHESDRKIILVSVLLLLLL